MPQAVANYLYRNRTRMHYDECLANGWPAASGPKDRMERSCMRRTRQMPEAIVQLRAIHLSGGLDCNSQFRIQQGRRRLYPAICVPT